MGSSKDGQGPLNFQVLVSPVLYISNVFHILFSLCKVTWTWSMQFALVSLVKKMAIDHPYHTILQVCASYLSSSIYFACFWSKICECTWMIKGNINQTLFCQTIYLISNLKSYIYLFYFSILNAFYTFVFIIIHPMPHKKKKHYSSNYLKNSLYILLSFWPWQMVTV